MKDKPGLAVIIASKKKGDMMEEDEGPKSSKAYSDMAEEIIANIESSDPKALGKSLANFVSYMLDERE